MTPPNGRSRGGHPGSPTTRNGTGSANTNGTERREHPQGDDGGGEVASYNPFDRIAPVQTAKRRLKFVEGYVYRTAEGKPWIKVLRWEPKSFSQEHWERGKWVKGLNKRTPVLYRLPQVMAAVKAGETIWFAEGEKDVASLEKQGLVATTMLGGALKKWLPEYTKVLENATVVIVHDVDPHGKGAKHARMVHDNLVGFATVSVLRPAVGKDVTDHLNAGKTLADLLPVQPADLPHAPAGKAAPGKAQTEFVVPRVLTTVLGLLVANGGMVKQPSVPGGDYYVTCPTHDDRDPSATLRAGDTRPVIFKCQAGCEPELFFEWAKAHGIPNAELMDTKGPVGGQVITRLDAMKAKRIHWLWHNHIAFGKVCNWEGDPEHGKSLVTIDLCARATRGGKFPDGSPAERCAVLFIAAEDDYEDTIIPRLMAATADRSLCFTLHPNRDAEGRILPFTLPDDAPRLTLAIAQTKEQSGLDNVIVIVDPVSAYLSESINSNNDASVRRAIHPLAELANDTGASFWLVRHLNKNSSEGNVAYRGGGSIGFFAAARHVFVFGRDKDNPSQIIMAQSKNNIGPKQSSLAYHIEVATVAEGVEAPRIEWDGASEVTADQLLVKKDSREAAPQREAAERALAELFQGEVDELAVKEVEAQLKELGMSPSTIKRAADRIGLVSVPVRTEAGKVDHWVFRRAIAKDGRIRVQSKGPKSGDAGGAR